MADAEAIQEAARLLGARLAALRASAGISQPQLAPLIGYSRSTIANAETGRRPAGRDFWQRCDQPSPLAAYWPTSMTGCTPYDAGSRAPPTGPSGTGCKISSRRSNGRTPPGIASPTSTPRRSHPN